MTGVSLIIGRKIRELRRHHNLTTRQLGYSAGISQQQMSRYERGVNRIHVDILYRISLVLRCGFDDFFTDIPPPAEASYYDEKCGETAAVIMVTGSDKVTRDFCIREKYRHRETKPRGRNRQSRP